VEPLAARAYHRRRRLGAREIITAQATLPEAARQMAILTVGSHFKAAYEL
jgi:hypothetical protein